MSRSGGAFTLLESGTSRLHFKLAKALEDASSPRESDLVVLETIDEIRTRLSSKSSARHLSELAPPLLTLLHCLRNYPSSGEQQDSLDVSFSLLPTLHLLSLATDWKDVLLAHQLLPFLLEGRSSSQPASGGSPGQSSAAPRDEDHSSSLLLLNTFRASLTSATNAASARTPHADAAIGPSTSSSSSRSRSRSRSPLPATSLGMTVKNPATSKADVRAIETLKSLASGIPKGPAVLPSLASTLIALTRHEDPAIRSLTLNAMLSCSSLVSRKAGDDATCDIEGQREMLDAALTIARLVLASTYAFSPGSDLDEQDGVILAEMEKRVDPNPAVLRSCLRIVEASRSAGLIASQELVCHIIEILQAIRSLPMHLDLKSLQQVDVAAQVINRTEGLRARAAARQRASLQHQHDYHSTYAPWLTEACLAALAESVRDLLGSIDQPTYAELLKSILRLYNTVSQGKAAALALCVAAARCIGALHVSTSESGSRGVFDGETAALWSALTQHTKDQLRSTNPNRKAAGIMLLDALLPVGWADQEAANASGEPGEEAPPPPPVQMTEEDMAHLMALLADPDSSIRRRALRLLHRVDPGLTKLMRSQLQTTVDQELQTAKGDHFDSDSSPIRRLRFLALRLVESAAFAVCSAKDATPSAGESEREAALALEAAVVSVMPLEFFGSFDPSSSSQATAESSVFLWKLQTPPLRVRLALMRRLLEEARLARPDSSYCALHLLCALLGDITAGDLKKDTLTRDGFSEWSASDLLGFDGLPGLLARTSQEDRVTAAAREGVLGIIARSISLMLQLQGLDQGASILSASLDALQYTLSKLIETESIAAIRLEASNLRLICSTISRPFDTHSRVLMAKIHSLAIAPLTISESVRWLLELELDDIPSSTPRARNAGQKETSLLAAASRLFAPASKADGRAAGGSTRPPSSIDSFDAVRLRRQLPASLLQSSALLSPEDSSITLRSDERSQRPRPSQPYGHARGSLSPSAIPSESKRTRDRRIANAMSESIANLVLGSDAQPSSSENDVIFSATSSGVLEGEELELVNEIADPERRLDVSASAGKQPTLLDLVHQCHNHEPWLDSSLTPFVLDGVQIGFLPARVVKACVDDSDGQRKAGLPAVLRKVRFGMHHREIVPPSASSRVCEAVTFTNDFATPDARTKGLNEVAQRWRQARVFPDPLDGWRDELYAIYGLNPRSGARNTIAFKLERAACALFGFATFGVHLTAYTVAPETGELRVWVPQRSSTKSTWPGYLDNSVAGGIVAGDLPMESVVRECEEEANLDAKLVEKHIKQTGVLSYCYKTSAQGWIQPEIEYVYDLPLPAEVTLQPKDGEVDHFELLSLDEIYDKMRQGRFKANCVLVLLDFLIRHGYITADAEPAYRQIMAQLHVDLRLPGP